MHFFETYKIINGKYVILLVIDSPAELEVSRQYKPGLTYASGVL